jgi:HPt (histidine-containing phosphotransfer) domain-containing protein
MIDYKELDESFKYYSTEVVIKIIDLFLDNHNEYIAMLQKNIADQDLDMVKFNAHKFKSVIGNFRAAEPFSLARELEEKATMGVSEGLTDLMEKLQFSTTELFLELTEYRTMLMEKNS